MKDVQAKYQKRLLVFFDILGFSEAIKNQTKSCDEIKSMFDEINIVIHGFKQDYDGFEIHNYSDSFIAHSKLQIFNREIFKLPIEILQVLLKYDFIARGAVVYGELYFENNSIYGSSLIDAVSSEINPKYHGHPRIIMIKALQI